MSKKIDMEVLFVIYERFVETTEKSEKEMMKYILRMVSWRGRPPVIEKRLIRFNDKTGDWFSMKKIGLDSDDYDELLKYKDKILTIFNDYKKLSGDNDG